MDKSAFCGAHHIILDILMFSFSHKQLKLSCSASIAHWPDLWWFQVQSSIGHSDYVKRDHALKNLIQPLAGEYGMHNNQPQGRYTDYVNPCWALGGALNISVYRCKYPLRMLTAGLNNDDALYQMHNQGIYASYT